MPIISQSDYHPPFWLLNAHWETILPAIVRKPKAPPFKRERISTRDEDFLDLDFVNANNEQIVILSHGLEGHSQKNYMHGMASYFFNHGWDTLSWNCRSCSEEINLTAKLYHHGATEDLEDVIKHVIKKNYKQIALIGFSLGGSLVVKYLGENGKNTPTEIIGGVAFSIPCQLGSCAREMSRPDNAFYLKRFLTKLKAKIKTKAIQFPEIFILNGIDSISNFPEFDTQFTAPLYGFDSADSFYRYASAGNYIEGIDRPTLLVNSLNDPMFPEDCYPYEAARDHKYFFLQTPEKGGHMGYWWPGKKVSWMEQRALSFISEIGR